MGQFAEQIFDPTLQAFANYTGHSFNNRRYELVNHLTKLYAMLNKLRNKLFTLFTYIYADRFAEG